MVGLCDRSGAGDHAGAAGRQRDGRRLRPAHRRAALVARRRHALRLGHRRRWSTCDADHLGRPASRRWGRPDGSTCSISARVASCGARTSPPTTQATSPEWGRSGSPLILDGKVIVSAGGGDGKSLVAYDARTGARVWSGGSDDAGYASPIVMTLLGRPQIVILNRVTLAGHDPATGAMLWSQPWVPTAQRRDADSRRRQPRARLDRLRHRQQAGEAHAGRRWRHHAGVRVGDAAPEGEVHQPGAPRRLRLRPRRRRAGVHGRDNGRAALARGPVRPRTDTAGGRPAAGDHRGRRGRAGGTHARGASRSGAIHGLRRQDVEPAGDCGQVPARAHATRKRRCTN